MGGTRPVRCPEEKPLYSLSARTARMDREKERKREFPELNPDGTRMTDEDRATTKGREEPKPWAPPPRRHGD